MAFKISGPGERALLLHIYDTIVEKISKSCVNDKLLRVIKEEMEDFNFCCLQFILLKILERFNKTQWYFQKEDLLIFGVYNEISKLMTDLQQIEEDLLKILGSDDSKKLSKYGSYKVNSSKSLVSR